MTNCCRRVRWKMRKFAENCFNYSRFPHFYKTPCIRFIIAQFRIFCFQQFFHNFLTLSPLTPSSATNYQQYYDFNTVITFFLYDSVNFLFFTWICFESGLSFFVLYFYTQFILVCLVGWIEKQKEFWLYDGVRYEQKTCQDGLVWHTGKAHQGNIFFVLIFFLKVHTVFMFQRKKNREREKTFIIFFSFMLIYAPILMASSDMLVFGLF